MSSAIPQYPNNQCLDFFQSRRFEYDSLKYRSDAEIAIAKAIDRYNDGLSGHDHSGVFYLPNCLIVTPKSRYKKSTYKMESDFLIFYNGNTGLLEVDGSHHNNPDVAIKDSFKKELYRSMGVFVIERFAAKTCYANPDLVVKTFLWQMNLIYSRSNKKSDIFTGTSSVSSLLMSFDQGDPTIIKKLNIAGLSFDVVVAFAEVERFTSEPYGGVVWKAFLESIKKISDPYFALINQMTRVSQESAELCTDNFVAFNVKKPWRLKVLKILEELIILSTENET